MDQLSADDARSFPAGLIAPITRMGERVATVEGRVDALKEDARVIRSSIHDINNHLQASLIAERQCALGITQLTERLAALGSQVEIRMTAHTVQIEDLMKEVKLLAQARAHAEGGWWAIARLMAFWVTTIGIMGAGIAWMIAHVGLK